MIIHSLTHSLSGSAKYSFIKSFIQSFVQFIKSTVHSLSQLFIHEVSGSFIHSFSHSLFSLKVDRSFSQTVVHSERSRYLNTYHRLSGTAHIPVHRTWQDISIFLDLCVLL